MRPAIADSWEFTDDGLTLTFRVTDRKESLPVRYTGIVPDLFTFANQEGLHNREHIEINDPERARTRWLLKTYAFKDRAAADRFADRWLDGVPGRVGD